MEDVLPFCTNFNLLNKVANIFWNSKTKFHIENFVE